MSDDAPILTSLEDDAPAAPAPAAAPEPPAAGALAPAPPEPEPADVDAVEVGGQKYVPLAAVIAERREKQSFKAQAEKAQQLEAWAQQAKPYVDFLQANPGLMQPRQPERAAPAAPTADPMAEQLARSLDLYKADGSGPDLDRAQQLVGLIDTLADRKAQQYVQPLRQTQAQTASERNFQAALQFKDPDGHGPTPNSLAALWRNLPAEYTADPNVASLLTLTAIGLDRTSQRPARAPVAAPPPATVTEGSGGVPRPRQALSDLERTIAKDRGIPETKWLEHTKGFVSGRSNVLEED